MTNIIAVDPKPRRKNAKLTWKSYGLMEVYGFFIRTLTTFA